MSKMEISNYTTVAGIKVDEIFCAVDIKEKVKTVNVDLQNKYSNKKEISLEENFSL